MRTKKEKRLKNTKNSVSSRIMVAKLVVVLMMSLTQVSCNQDHKNDQKIAYRKLSSTSKPKNRLLHRTTKNTKNTFLDEKSDKNGDRWAKIEQEDNRDRSQLARVLQTPSLTLDRTSNLFKTGNALFNTGVALTAIFAILNLPGHPELLKIQQTLMLMSLTRIQMPKRLYNLIYPFQLDSVYSLVTGYVKRIRFAGEIKGNEQCAKELAKDTTTAAYQYFSAYQVPCDIKNVMVPFTVWFLVLVLARFIHLGVYDIFVDRNWQCNFAKAYKIRTRRLRNTPIWYYFMRSFSTDLGFLVAFYYMAPSTSNLVTIVVIGVVLAALVVIATIKLTRYKLNPPVTDAVRQVGYQLNNILPKKGSIMALGTDPKEPNDNQLDISDFNPLANHIDEKPFESTEESEFLYSEDQQTNYTRQFIADLIQEYKLLQKQMEEKSENTFKLPWWLCSKRVDAFVSGVHRRRICLVKFYKLLRILFDFAVGVTAGMLLNRPDTLVIALLCMNAVWLGFTVLMLPYKNCRVMLTKAYPYFCSSLLWGGFLLFDERFSSGEMKEDQFGVIYMIGMFGMILIAALYPIFSVLESFCRSYSGDQEEEEFNFRQLFMTKFSKKTPKPILQRILDGKLLVGLFKRTRQPTQDDEEEYVRVFKEPLEESTEIITEPIVSQFKPAANLKTVKTLNKGMMTLPLEVKPKPGAVAISTPSAFTINKMTQTLPLPTLAPEDKSPKIKTQSCSVQVDTIEKGDAVPKPLLINRLSQTDPVERSQQPGNTFQGVGESTARTTKVIHIIEDRRFNPAAGPKIDPKSIIMYNNNNQALPPQGPQTQEPQIHVMRLADELKDPTITNNRNHEQFDPNPVNDPRQPSLPEETIDKSTLLKKAVKISESHGINLKRQLDYHLSNNQMTSTGGRNQNQYTNHPGDYRNARNGGFQTSNNKLTTPYNNNYYNTSTDKTEPLYVYKPIEELNFGSDRVEGHPKKRKNRAKSYMDLFDPENSSSLNNPYHNTQRRKRPFERPPRRERMQNRSYTPTPRRKKASYDERFSSSEDSWEASDYGRSRSKRPRGGKPFVKRKPKGSYDYDPDSKYNRTRKRRSKRERSRSRRSRSRAAPKLDSVSFEEDEDLERKENGAKKVLSKAGNRVMRKNNHYRKGGGQNGGRRRRKAKYNTPRKNKRRRQK